MHKSDANERVSEMGCLVGLMQGLGEKGDGDGMVNNKQSGGEKVLFTLWVFWWLWIGLAPGSDTYFYLLSECCIIVIWKLHRMLSGWLSASSDGSCCMIATTVVAVEQTHIRNHIHIITYTLT